MRYAMALVAVLNLGSFAVADERIKDPSRLEGRYEIVGGQTDSIPYRTEEMAGVVVTIKGNNMTFTGKDKNVFLSFTFTIDTTGVSTPQIIALTTITPDKGLDLEGIIDREGDTVRFCYAQAEKGLPTSFAAKKNQYSFVFKRIR